MISAPSGAGKTSLVKAMIKKMNRVAPSISYTTRPKRSGEKEGVDYYFIDEHEFQKKVKEGIFLEYARVFDHFYGTSRTLVEDRINQGFDVILEIDWQGAAQIRQKFSDMRSIFVLPLNYSVLTERLKNRDPDRLDIIEKRMAEAKGEIAHYKEYNYIIFNDQFDEALADLCAIIRSDRCFLARQQIANEATLKNLLI